jgi:GntR family transcriptional regulator/MocR family aminotransferase
VDVHISLGPVGDRADRVYRGLADAIIEGRLRPGDTLPPTRELARQLEVSRTTITVAYDRLLAEGFTIARVGSGTFVAPVREATGLRRAPRGREVAPRPIWAGRGDLPTTHVPAAYDFAIGVPDARLFPLQRWRRNVARELQPGAAVLGGYDDPRGHRPLRSAIARHIGLSRAVRAGEEDVIVTSGAQQAFDLVTRVLVAPGDTVAVEEPGYPPVRALLESQGARVVGVRVDVDGMVVSEIPARAKLVYTTPSHQFPMGVRTSLARRRELLAWAAAVNGVILEDDYDSEFRYGDRSLDPLQSLDRAGRVVYVGTFSKTLLPGLRVGFLVAPESLHDALVAAKRLVDWHTDTVTQAALANLIDDGSFAAHVRRVGRIYGERRERILDGIPRELSRWLGVVPSAAGLHLVAEFLPGVLLSGPAVTAAAAAAGVGIQSIEPFATAPGAARGLVLGFGVIEASHIDDGLGRLATVLARLA